jgi:hypothetical protein
MGCSGGLRVRSGGLGLLGPLLGRSFALETHTTTVQRHDEVAEDVALHDEMRISEVSARDQRSIDRGGEGVGTVEAGGGAAADWLSPDRDGGASLWVREERPAVSLQ